MRTAFTMIELIFVIVILGILAAVAIPKLSVTRDDAKVSQTINSVNVAMSEISAYVLSQGRVEDDLSLMSNSLNNLQVLNLATVDIGQRKADIKAGQVDNCLTIQVVNSGGDENITVAFGTAGADVVCSSIQTRINTNGYSVPIGGQIVEF